MSNRQQLTQEPSKSKKTFKNLVTQQTEDDSDDDNSEDDSDDSVVTDDIYHPPSHLVSPSFPKQLLELSQHLQSQKN